MLALLLILITVAWCVDRVCRAWEYPTRTLDGLEGELGPAVRAAIEEGE